MSNNGIVVFDNFLNEPHIYREIALRGEFRTFDFPGCTFHGISIPTPPTVPDMIVKTIHHLKPTLSFFRKSPKGQAEPHFIHTDADMGDWSAILYLNPKPPIDDGTLFWSHLASGEDGNSIPHLRSEEGSTPAGWRMRRAINGNFNRLLMFPSHFFHSRSIPENWGNGDNARLTQVIFGTGRLA